MFLLREMVKTCEYVVLVLVECYLLAVLKDVAGYCVRNPSLEHTSRYFESIGYSKSYPNIEPLSHNYVTLAY